MKILHYVDNRIVPAEEAKINVLDLCVLRGYGVFDYIQLYKGRPFHLRDHLERLKWSAEQIELKLPKTLDEIENAVKQLVEVNPPIDAGIRLIVTGGSSSNDQLLPTTKSSLVMIFHPYTPNPDHYYIEGMRLITTPMLRMLPAIKTTNYMPAIFGMKKAKNMGFHDAIYINERQELLEATTSNAFFFKNNVLITLDSEEIIKGITRKIFLEIAKPFYHIEFRPVRLNELSDCEEAFLCSSVKDAIPLVQVDGKKVGNGLPGPKTKQLRELFRKYIVDYFA